MIAFHRFVMDGKITMPAIARRDIALTGNGNTYVEPDHFEITFFTSICEQH
ncbi:hypothetical protein [Acinetobacter baumannii]|uniref:hypothetical protein n=1 Tax=Acinetobacter baumannii TaxID=470 RepID=UPI001E2B227D|nr:hypothetical protein [Acinetobacter baumannii]